MTRRTLPAATAAVALAAFAPAVLAFAVDGKLSAGDSYSVDITVPFVVDGGSVSSSSGHLLVGRDGSAGDIFLLLEVPTDLKDLTYGANSAPGWGDTTTSNWGNVQGSEKWKFTLAGAGTVELKLKAVSDTVGYDLSQDAGGTVLAGSTSLDYNMSQFDYQTPGNNPGGLDLKSTSPPCGSGGGTDADCYANPGAGFANYEFAQLYELQLKGSDFASGLDLSTFGSYISAAEVHASPNKVGGRNQINLVCNEDYNNTSADLGSCGSTTTNGGGTPGVPEPPALLLLAAGLLGLAASRRRGV